MNNPFPTRAQLRSEAAIARLLDEQAATTKSFHTIIAEARAAIGAMHFPLGSPAHRYDLEDIIATMGDWLIERDPAHLEEYAEDAILSRIEGPQS